MSRFGSLAHVAVVCCGALWASTAAARSTHDTAIRELPNFGVEVRLAPYAPRVGGKLERDYYDTFFGKSHKNNAVGRGPLLKSVELDWYVQRDFGLLGLLTRVGWWSVSGNMRACTDAAGDTVVCTGEGFRTSESGNSVTGITIVPVSVAVIYRMDLLKRALGVPLVFHVKGGVDYHFWWISAKNKRARLGTDNAPARGATAGASGSVGVALNLDWIEPRTALRGFRSTGMTDTYLLFEATKIVADGFGDSERFDMSDTLFSLALGVDFQ